MAIKVYKPTTPGRRGMTSDAFTDITKKKPEKALTVTLKKKAGRNAQGKITVRHRGGGAKRKYRIIEFGSIENKKAIVEAIEYDPNRSARIALIKFEDGKKAYIIAPQGMIVEKKLEFGAEADVKTGNRMPLSKIPVGTTIHNVEIILGKGAQLARSAGTSAQLVAREGAYGHVKLPSGEIRLVDVRCYASVGAVSNPDHSNIKIGKAGRKRHMGIRPTVTGKSMNPVDHPHGGGEGHQPIGMKHPKTPWGAAALGLVTRKRNKPSNKYIVRKRKKKR